MIKIGWATRSVATTDRVGILGQFYQRISTGVLDEILVTALVIEREDVSIMVSADMVSIGDNIIFDIRDAVKKKEPEIPVENIMMNATHTHTSPRYVLKTGFDEIETEEKPEAPEKYRSFFVDKTSDAIVEAYRSRSAGSFAYGYGSAETGVSRRVIYMDDYGMRNTVRPDSLAPNGHGVMYGKTNDELFSGYEGGIDTNVYFLFTFDDNEELTGCIINAGCPAQCGEFERYLSSDYWYFVRKFIREKYGNIHILPQCSAAGDISPHRLHAINARDRRHRLKYSDDPVYSVNAAGAFKPNEYYNKIDIAERVFHAFEEVYSWAPKEKYYDVPIIHRVMDAELDAWEITEEQYLQAKTEYDAYAKDGGFNSASNVANEDEKKTIYASVMGRYSSVIQRYENKKDKVTVEIHNVRIGDVSFSSSPYELYLDYQHRIQARSPFIQSFIVQLAASTGVAGYLPTVRAKENKGYSAIMYSCTTSPKGGDQLVDITISELKKLSSYR